MRLDIIEYKVYAHVESRGTRGLTLTTMTFELKCRHRRKRVMKKSLVKQVQLQDLYLCTSYSWKSTYDYTGLNAVEISKINTNHKISKKGKAKG